MNKTQKPFLKEYLPYLMFRTHSLMTTRLYEAIKQQGYTRAEWRILSTLSDNEHKQGMTINQLVKATQLPQPTVSRWITKLHEKGLIKRLESNNDLRHRLVTLSAKGKKSAETLLGIADSHQADAVSVFSRTDLNKLIAMLQEMVSGLEEEDERRNRIGKRRLG